MFKQHVHREEQNIHYLEENLILCYPMRVITKLPNTEQFSKGKAKLICQQTDKISQQPENRNGPDLVQTFPKKWWVESDFTAPNLPLPLRLKGSGCHYNSIFNNTGTN